MSTVPCDPAIQSMDTVEVGEDVVLVRAVGGIAGHRADELWSELEGALELAAGRLVVVDLGRVRSFDECSIDVLRAVARACHRRQVDIHLLVGIGSPLERYALGDGLGAEPANFSPPGRRRRGRNGYCRVTAAQR